MPSHTDPERDQIEEFPEDWSRALAILPHPDDMEYTGAAAVARWTDHGKQVSYLLLTSGEAGIDSLDPKECAAIRQSEQRASAEIVGVDTLEFLDYPDGTIEYGLPLRQTLAAAIRRHQPDLVIAVNHRETYYGTILNMADHRVVGLATIDAVKDAANRWIFTELRDAGLEPWHGVRYLAIVESPQPTHAVDVTDTFDRGVEALRQHGAYLRGLGQATAADPETFLRSAMEATAARFNGRLAVAYELYRL